MQTTNPQTGTSICSVPGSKTLAFFFPLGLWMSGKEFYGKGGHGYEADLERPAACKLPLWANVR